MVNFKVFSRLMRGFCLRNRRVVKSIAYFFPSLFLVIGITLSIVQSEPRYVPLAHEKIVVMAPGKGSSWRHLVSLSSIKPLHKQKMEENLMSNTEKDVLIHNQDFGYLIDHPSSPSGEIIVLLHGSGGDERHLLSFARPIWPHAILIGIRGRVVQNGEIRWFEKITPTKFDQKDAVQESDAFVVFLIKLSREVGYDLSKMTFVGYSNGANMLAIMAMKHPEIIHRAILMRSMPVLDKMPEHDLKKTSVLVISGEKDMMYSPYAPALIASLKANGAVVESHAVERDHMIGDEDADTIRKWIFERVPKQVSINISRQ